MHFLVDNEDRHTAFIKSNRCVDFKTKYQPFKDRELIDCTIIYTPIVWDLHESFQDLLAKEKENSMISKNKKYNKPMFPYLLWDLHRKMLEGLPKQYLNEQIVENIQSQLEQIIGGSFGKEEREPYYFLQQSSRRSKIPLRNTAIGVKNLGIIQILLEKNRFTPQVFFIFDEPENHLHQDWILKFAMIVTTLVKNGIRIMINTHSPFMLNALNECVNILSIPYSLYLARDGLIENHNDQKQDIYEKLRKGLDESVTNALEKELLAINKIVLN